MVLEGSQLGRYKLVQRVGVGGMGEIYLANDTRISRQVALKVLRSGPDADTESTSPEEAAMLFLREAQAIATLDHPYILPLFDYGEEEIDNKKVAFLVMPFRNEGTLKDWLRRRQPGDFVPVHDVVALIAQAASALQYAHNRRIIHQDVKPSNFLLRSNPDHPQRPDVLLADFGIAKESGSTTKLNSNPRGTPGYMAPEQWEGRAYPATDQYALAIMAYEMLTGRQPFQGNQHQLMYAHLRTQPEPPSTYNPHISEAIDRVILQALAKRADERFPSIAAFVTALQQAATANQQTSLNTYNLIYSISNAPHNSTAFQVPSTVLPPGSLQTINSATDVPPAARQLPSMAEGKSRPEQAIQMAPQRKRSIDNRIKVGLLVGLALLVILVGSAGAFVYFARQPQPDVRATVTTQPPTATPTRDPLTSKDNPYPPYKGTLVLDDTLRDNSKGYNWMTEQTVPQLYICNFSGQGYHASTFFGGLVDCFSQIQMDNGAFQVRVTLLRGYSAGLLLRGSHTSKSFYYFYIRNDGSYGLEVYKASSPNPTAIIKKGGSAAIHTKAGQSNLLAIVAQGDQLDLYINQQHVDTIHDTHASKGSVGVASYSDIDPVDAVFDSARAWKF